MNPPSRHALAQIIVLVALVSSIGSAMPQDISAGERKYGFCASCHGIDGRSVKVNYPILAGQAAPYILRQLQDFKSGRRSDPNMGPVAEQLSEEDMRDLAAFFASRESYSSPWKSEPIKVARGKKKAKSGRCDSCHPERGESPNTELPRIQGQHRNYLMKQLMDFRSGRRANDRGVMQRVAQEMTAADSDDLGSYFAAMNSNRSHGKRR